MTGRKRTGWLVTGWLLAGLLGAGAFGCTSDSLGYLGYLLAPAQRPVKVPAEYEGLAGRTVAVVIYADQKVQYEYPYARLSLSSMLASELRQNVKDVTVVDPRRVIKYQDENIHWGAMDKTRLGQVFGADAVLYLVLDQYTMREPGSIGLYRGQVSAQARVYDTAMPERQACVWRGDDFHVIHPPTAPTGELGQDDSKVRYETEQILARAVIGKFYNREIRPEQQ